MRAINYGLDRPADVITAAVLCCECRLCEAYACPLGLSPMAYYKEIKRQLRAQGWRESVHTRTELHTHPAREYRRVPTERLIARLGLAEYAEYECPLDEREKKPERVVIPLRQHTGAPAEPVVRPGDRVKAGDVIGEIPAGQLGARVHASLTGIVDQVAPGHHIVIRGS